MINVDLNNIPEATEYPEVHPGAYVGIIEEVDHRADKQGIILWLDIAEGDCAGYYAQLYEDKEFWGLTSFRSYKQTALKYFKKFIEAVEASNMRYKWDGDEQKLKGNKVGMVLKSEQYTKSNGEAGFKFVVDQFVPVKELPKYPVPGKQAAYAAPETPEFMQVNDNEGIPFN